MIIKRSTKNLFRIHGWKNLVRFLHGYIYFSRIDQYVFVVLKGALFSYRYLPRKVSLFFLNLIVLNYHSKVVRLEDAKKFVTLNADLRVDPSTSEKVIPFEIANKILIENPDNIVAMDCACRAVTKKYSSPKFGIQVCLMIGDPHASFCLEHSSRTNARRVTSDEALEILQDAHNLGWVHTVWFKDVAGGRSYAICNCCKDACAGFIGTGLISNLGYEHDAILSSGYVARVDEGKCKGCIVCEKFCQFEACRINVQKKKAEVIYDKCLGCGVCVSKCPQDAITLVRDPRKGIPLDIDELPTSRVM